MLFDLYVVFIFILYYGLLVNTITILSIFNYLHKFDGRVLYPHSRSKGFYDALDKDSIYAPNVICVDVEYGKTWFLTREEAEKKLEEMKNGK